MNALRVSLPDRLKALPDFDPAPGGWERLVNQMERSPPRRRRRTLAPLALAASVLAALGVARLMPVAPTPPAAGADEVAQLMRQSRDLEQALETVRPRVTVWDGQLAATATNLRNDLAMVDLQLSYASGAQPAAVQRLWQNRVSLMSRLVQTHEDATLASDPYPQEQIL